MENEENEVGENAAREGCRGLRKTLGLKTDVEDKPGVN
jgi:hypothetical protein